MKKGSFYISFWVGIGCIGFKPVLTSPDTHVQSVIKNMDFEDGHFLHACKKVSKSITCM